MTPARERLASNVRRLHSARDRPRRAHSRLGSHHLRKIHGRMSLRSAARLTTPAPNNRRAAIISPAWTPVRSSAAFSPANFRKCGCSWAILPNLYSWNLARRPETWRHKFWISPQSRFQNSTAPCSTRQSSAPPLAAPPLPRRSRRTSPPDVSPCCQTCPQKFPAAAFSRMNFSMLCPSIASFAKAKKYAKFTSAPARMVCANNSARFLRPR